MRTLEQESRQAIDQALQEFAVIQQQALTDQRAVAAPNVLRRSMLDLSDLIFEIFGDRPAPKQPPLVELSARVPYSATYGWIDSYHPGRWDCESDLVFMNPIVQVGPSVGEWDGTVVYVSLPGVPPGTYLVVGNFSGYDTTMHMNGPWGDVTAYTAATTDIGTVIALTTVTQGLYFSMSCKGSGLGYLESVQLFPM
jgi:hypothetical protein